MPPAPSCSARPFCRRFSAPPLARWKHARQVCQQLLGPTRLYEPVELTAALDAAQTYVLQTAAFDARFPNTNQSRHCVRPSSGSVHSRSNSD